ncbi:MAG: Hsp33 family molecular chaperone HslO [Ruminococcaceae bacterium]|nr:Hsp33 family molecular chaperone HslO [Oscillospiraceae bacterium]
MNDHIVRAMTRDGFVKAAAISSKGIVERARQIHKCLPMATAALGRTLSACSLMGNMQKVENGSVTLQIKGGGPLGTILAVSDSVGNVRGYVTNPAVSLMEKYRGKLNVGDAVGTDGRLTVIRDLQMKEPYNSSIELISGEIAEDLTYYFAQSEQVPTACALGVLVQIDQTVQAAGGYIIQLLPGAPEEIIDRIEEGIQNAGNVTYMLEKGLSPQQIIETVLKDFDLEILESTPVEYRCYCSQDRVERTLLSLGRKELEEIAADNEDVHIQCQFCDVDYCFTPERVRQLLESLG